MKTKLILTLLFSFIALITFAQKPKPKHYRISFADTVNVYNKRTVIVVKDIKGGFKYIVVRKPNTYEIKEANVVNIYK